LALFFCFDPLHWNSCIAWLQSIRSIAWWSRPTGNTSDSSVRCPGLDSRPWQGCLCLPFLFCCFYFFVQNLLFVMRVCNYDKHQSYLILLHTHIIFLYNSIERNWSIFFDIRCVKIHVKWYRVCKQNRTTFVLLLFTMMTSRTLNPIIPAFSWRHNVFINFNFNL